MNILFAFAGGVMERLEKLNQSDLPLGLVSRVRRLLRHLKEEVSMHNSDREKILREFCTLEEREGGEQYWKFPLVENEKYIEFQKRWEDLQNVKLIFPYEPIDYLAFIDATPDEIKKKIIAKGSDFQIIDDLNETYEQQFKKENEPATSAGEANTAGDGPVASPAPIKEK